MRSVERPTEILGKLVTYFRLGPANVARVALYQLGLRTRLHPVCRVEGRGANGPFFSARRRTDPDLVPTMRWSRSAELFSAHHFPLPDVPAWHLDPFSAGGSAVHRDRRWFTISDTDPLCDIKTVWEYSRFDWLPAMAQRAALGDSAELDRINRWLQDWSTESPPYLGSNWKCGQEAAIRVMHLAAAAMLLNSPDSPLAGLLALVKTHLSRIAPTMSYAIGQQNNHATSEAAALFIGGSWLAANGDKAGERWARTGRRWLERLARRLIASDGTFSQYSVVYHRLMLDTYSLSEIWRRRLALPPFSAEMMRRVASAAHWQRQMTDPVTGDSPNLGANDGARLIALTDSSFRDFRPSLQLATAVFCNKRAIQHAGEWDRPLKWLGVSLPTVVAEPLQSETFDDGGFHILRKKHAAAYFRYPRFRFRPSQSDALHIDLWVDGRNILRDGGSFSYRAGDIDGLYLNSVRAHNTAEFDSRDQMPRIGRFLFGSWLKATGVESVDPTSGDLNAAAGYRDIFGATHHRWIELEDECLICVDQLGGKAERAVIRWRLAPGDWFLKGNSLTNGKIAIDISSDRPVELELTSGLESLHYLEKATVPVLEISCSMPTTVRSEVRF